MPPIKAASRTKDTSSKGKINLVSNISPKSSVDEPEAIVTSPSKPFIKIYENKRTGLYHSCSTLFKSKEDHLSTNLNLANIL